MRRLATALSALIFAGAASAAGWEYGAEENEMTGEVAETTAMIQRYSEPFMQLVIRNSKGDGLQAYVFPEDGEVNCPGACQLLVRVDDAPPKSFAVTVRRFEFSYRLDFADPSALVQHIRYAKRLRVLLRYLDIPGNKNKGDVVWTVNPEAPLVVRPLRKAVQ